MKKLIFIFFIIRLTIYSEILQVNLGEEKNAEIYYEIIGEGKPIVILHSAAWGYLEPVFKKYDGLKRIYIDPPGIGKSSSDAWIKTADDCLDILLYSIDNIIPEENFAVYGFSYFGYMARGIISERKEKIIGALLVCPVIFPEYGKRKIPINFYSDVDSVFFNSLDQNEKEFFDGFATINEKSYSASKKLQRKDVLMNVEFWNKIKKNNYSFSFDPDKKISSFENPVVIIAGRQDKVVGYTDVENLFPVFPNALIVFADNAGHSLPYEKNELLNFLIKNWIEKINSVSGFN
ncbi:MAG: alpha/beta hydrolase [Melioribacteraceae bacterium]|nr:MAG: alpha/beta hydrolase [Melioribacteraceae bacterium]